MGRRQNGTGSISLRADGRYQGSLRQGGRRVAVYGRSKAEVQKKLADLQYTTATIGYLPEPHTLGELLDRWLDLAASELKPRTIADYRVVAEVLKKHLGQGTKLDKLRPDHIQAMYGRLKGAPRRARYAHQVLHRALRMAVLWQWIPNNPADRVISPKYESKRKEVWSPDKMARFLDTALRWRPLWLVLATCGLRIGEGRALTWPDIDLDAGTLRVCRSIQLIAGAEVVTTPKTRTSIRTLAVPVQAIDALRYWQCRQAAELVALGKRNTPGWVWTNDEGELVGYRGLHSAFLRDAARAGLKGNMHMLRHFHATLLLANGFPVADTARRMGHSNPAVLMSVYAHAIGDDSRAAEIAAQTLQLKGWK